MCRIKVPLWSCIRVLEVNCCYSVLGFRSSTRKFYISKVLAVLVAGMAEVDRGGGFPCRPSVAPPLKTFMNLTSTVDNVAFSPDQQVTLRWLIL